MRYGFGLTFALFFAVLVVGSVMAAKSCNERGGRYGLMGRVPHCWEK